MNLKIHIIPDEHLIKICKYRQGAECCKHIMYSPGVSNFICTKLIPKLNEFSKNSEMRAKGDNCNGI
jgi:hypothetical protein